MRNNRRAGKPAGRKPDKTGLLGLFTKGKDIPTTAQQTLPYREMYRDGVCRVADCYYTKTIEYEDINYQLAQSEDQAAIFDGWSACLNYFDSSLSGAPASTTLTAVFRSSFPSSTTGAARAAGTA